MTPQHANNTNLLSEGSLVQLMNNDSLKYEPNMQSVIDEYYESSR